MYRLILYLLFEMLKIFMMNYFKYHAKLTRYLGFRG